MTITERNQKLYDLRVKLDKKRAEVAWIEQEIWMVRDQYDQQRFQETPLFEEMFGGWLTMTNTVRIIDKLGLFPETRGKARYITVKTYAHAMEIVDEQNKLGNIATLINW